MSRTCSLCDAPHHGCGYCQEHYSRWRRWGDPLAGSPPRGRGTVLERFLERVDQDGPIPEHAPELGPCALWTGPMRANGYGSFSPEYGQTHSAHVWSYTHFVGPVPKGKQVDHRCHNTDPTCPSDDSCLHRRCIRPTHLEAATPRENNLRSNGLAAVNARKTHCPQGHPYDEANTYTDGKGRRFCRACARAKQRARRRKP